MPDTLFLHIQTRASQVTRVLELAGPSVRVGRGKQCEVQLHEPALAEVQCLLRKRGETWYVQPVGPSGRLSIEGRSVEQQRAIPIGATLRVGGHWLRLKPEPAASEETPAPLILDADLQAPEHVSTERPFERSPHQHEEAAAATPSGPDMLNQQREQLERWQTRLQHRERWLKDRQLEKRWEARWRAAGASLRTTKAAPSRSSSTDAATARPQAPAPPRPAGAEAPSRHVPFVPVRETPTPVQPPSRFDRPFTSRDLENRRGTCPNPDLASVPQTSEQSKEGEGTDVSRPGAAAEVAPSPPTRSLGASHNTQPLPTPTPPSRIEVEPDQPALSASEPAPTATAETFWDGPIDGLLEIEAESTEIEALPAGDEMLEAAAEVADTPVGRQLGVALISQEPNPLQHGTVDRSSATDSAVSPLEHVAPDHAATATGLVPEAKVEETSSLLELPLIELEDLLTVLEGGTLGPRRNHRALVNHLEEPSHAPNADREEPVEPFSDREPDATEDPRPASAVDPEPSLESAAPVPGRPVPAEVGAGDGRRFEAHWPSARAILEAQRVPAAPRQQTSKSRRHAQTQPQPQPTNAQEPERCSVPALKWLWVPILLASFGLGAGLVRMSVTWAEQERVVGQLANALLQQSGAPASVFRELALLEESLPPSSWLQAPAEHLYLRAFALMGSEPDLNREQRALMLLTEARKAAPAQPSIRHAIARQESGDAYAEPPLALSLGLSRDVVTLTWSARQLLRAGKPDRALLAYRSALEMACQASLDRLEPPSYQSDPQVRRFNLPYESLLVPILRDMADHPDWDFDQWSEALPAFAVAPLAAARVLRERGSPDARKALELAATRAEESAPPATSAAIHVAAGAEAMALSQRWDAAEPRYRLALDLMPEGTLRRAFSFNLADVYSRLGDAAKMQTARRAAMVQDANDEITELAIRAQMNDGYGLVGRSSEPETTAGLAPLR